MRVYSTFLSHLVTFPPAVLVYFLFHASVLNRNYFSTDSIICPFIPVILFLVGFLLQSLLYNIIPPIKVQFFLCCVYTLIQSSTGFLSLLLYLYSLLSLLFPFIPAVFISSSCVSFLIWALLRPSFTLAIATIWDNTCLWQVLISKA